ncbi:hypothetical protein vBCbaSRXM_79 [Citromicrobium phage vB_CbaS-RXM]|nr:hypothetical protein vBCbaSRXM_79 [Citromicrobium phage vB_CbaS-RXM]
MKDRPGCERRHPPDLHFVGFRGEEYWSAVKVWGKPGMIHGGWDRRAQRDVCYECDTVIFATGDENQPVREFNFNDIKEPASDE